MNPWGKQGRDHPHIRSPKGVMSCDEIRYWIRALREDHGWPTKCLARTLGCANDGAMKSKLKRSWIFPGEQVKFSRQIDRILSGELVAVKTGKGSFGRWDAVVADHPVPLKLPARMVYNLLTGRLGYAQQRLRPEPVIPSFATILKLAVPLEDIAWRE